MIMDAQSNKRVERCPRKKLICVGSMQFWVDGMPQVTAGKRRIIRKSESSCCQGGCRRKCAEIGSGQRVRREKQLSKVSENGITSAYEPTAGASK